MVEKIKIHRYKDGEKLEIEETVIKEIRANLFINGEFFLSIMCMPHDLQELAVGFLYSEGILNKYLDISEIIATPTGNIYVSTNSPVDLAPSQDRVLISGCASGSVNLAFLKDKNLKKIRSSNRISAQTVTAIMARFSGQSEIFRITGAVHSASLLFSDGNQLFFEDIGRHNAVDKIVGAALMRNRNLEDGILLISGRISSEIVLKVAKLGIPILISQAAPTSMSVAIANHVDLTLVGFARGKRFNVYSASERIY